MNDNKICFLVKYTMCSVYIDSVVERMIKAFKKGELGVEPIEPTEPIEPIGLCLCIHTLSIYAIPCVLNI